MFHRESCRLCGSKDLELVVKLKPIPLAEKYYESSEAAKRADLYPVDLHMCLDCGHVQQLDVIDSETVWDDYTYYSGKAKGMAEHFRDVAAKVVKAYPAPAGALAIDIGSNDGSLLRPFKDAGYKVLGVDPVKEIARMATEAGIETIPSVMSLDLAKKIREKHGPAAVVSAFNVFAHADDMGDMADSIREVLAPDGVFLFEAQYLLDIIEKMMIGTVFHEHISHHSLKPMKKFLESHGMELIDVERVSIQNGSIIGTAQLAGGKRKPTPAVGSLLKLEEERGLDRPETAKGLAERLRKSRDVAASLIARWKDEKASVAGYGAARSGPTLISQLGFAGAIDYIVDDHPQKVFKYTPGDGIQVLPTEELYKRMPKYTIILAWVHADKIIAANRKYLDDGGHFVTLSPEIKIH